MDQLQFLLLSPTTLKRSHLEMTNQTVILADREGGKGVQKGPKWVDVISEQSLQGSKSSYEALQDKGHNHYLQR